MYLSRLKLSGLAAVVLVTLGLVSAFLMSAFQARHLAEGLLLRFDDFQRVMEGVKIWEEVTGRMPSNVYQNSSGTPCYSWRLAILRYIESIDYAEEVPWDDPRNKHLADSTNPVYCSSLASREPATFETTMCALVGPDTAFDSERTNRLADLPADLIVLIEVANSGIHWMAPGDLDIRAIPPSVTEGTSGEGVIVAFADGTLWFLRSTVPLETLQCFFTVAGAKTGDRETVLGRYRLASRQRRAF